MIHPLVLSSFGAASGLINLPQLYSHIDDNLLGCASELMATCDHWSIILIAWSSRRLSDLARSVYRSVTSVCCYPRRRWQSGEVVLLERTCWSGSGWFVILLRLHWWEATDLGPRQHGDVPPVDVPHRHVPHCLQHVFSSTHKAMLGMVFFFGSCNGGGSCVSPGVRLDDAGVRRQPLGTVVAGNPRNCLVFLDLLGFYQQIMNNNFILVCLLFSTCVASCNLFFD
jgi:hypothetical protein